MVKETTRVEVGAVSLNGNRRERETSGRTVWGSRKGRRG